MAMYTLCRCRKKMPYGTKWCEECEPKVKAERNKNSRFTRDKATEEFYNSSAWRKKRDEVMKDNHYLCYVCKLNKRYERANEVHHIKNLKNHIDLGLEDDNLVCLCYAHHDEVHENKLQSLEEIREYFERKS